MFRTGLTLFFALSITAAASEELDVREVAYLQAARDSCIGLAINEPIVLNAMSRATWDQLATERASFLRKEFEKVFSDEQECAEAFRSYGSPGTRRAGLVRLRLPATNPEDFRFVQIAVIGAAEISGAARYCNFAIDQAKLKRYLANFGASPEDLGRYATPKSMKDADETLEWYRREPQIACPAALKNYGPSTRWSVLRSQ